MGRKSKKVFSSIMHQWRLGIYTRRSFDDGEIEESDTIKNQRDLITNYLKSEKDITIVDYYSDDGYSGTTFNRPDFKRMFTDIVNGKINTVIVKDLSRFGRNYIEVGNYLEQIFPLYDVRFIAINDNIDSFKDPKSVNNAIVAFKNLMNDEYARDISKKVRSYYQTKAEKGEFAGGTPPYGYMIDPLDKHHLVINPEEEKIIKLIFKKALAGEGKIKICKYLNNNGILCRKELQRRRKHKLSLIPEEEEIVYRWSTSTIGRILSSEVYIGSVVQNKTTTPNYKIHKVIEKPKSEWKVVENKHEPIISKNKFYKVQELIKEKNVKKKKATNFSIYNKKLKCADCGKAMYKVEDTRNGRNISNYYCMSHQLTTNTCSPHKIKTAALNKAVLDAILVQVKLVVNLENAIKKLREETLSENVEQQYQKNLKKIDNDIDKYKRLKKSSYEDWKLGRITQDEFSDCAKDYDERIETLNKEINAIQEVYQENIKNVKKDDYWIEHFRRNKKVKVLTKDVIDELIEVIYVHEDGNVNIKFNYQDEYEQALKLINNE